MEYIQHWYNIYNVYVYRRIVSPKDYKICSRHLISYKGKSTALRIRQAVLSYNDNNFKQLRGELKQSYMCWVVLFFHSTRCPCLCLPWGTTVHVTSWSYDLQSCDCVMPNLCHVVTPQSHHRWLFEKINNQGSTTLFLLIFVMYGFAICIKELKIINCLMFITSNK